MTWTLALQIVAIGTTLGSIYLTGRKSVWGPLLGGPIGLVPWTAFYLMVGAPLMIGLSLVITALHLNILRDWRRQSARLR